MKIKKIPMRTCVITKEKLPKSELLRIVRTPEGHVIVDTSGKANGRGAYIKGDLATLEKVKKGNALSYHLECDIPPSIYEEILNIINNSSDEE